MKYKDVLDAVLDRQPVRPSKNHPWLLMDASGKWFDTEKCNKQTITRHLYTWNTWEIKPVEMTGVITSCNHDVLNITRVHLRLEGAFTLDFNAKYKLVKM